jgi:hypothetical protein
MRFQFIVSLINQTLILNPNWSLCLGLDSFQLQLRLQPRLQLTQQFFTQLLLKLCLHPILKYMSRWMHYNPNLQHCQRNQFVQCLLLCFSSLMLFNFV